MASTTLRKLLDLKVWQACVPSPITNAANFAVAASDGPDQLVYYLVSTSGVYTYDPNEDAWGLLPSPALATFAAGAAVRWHSLGPTGTAAAGSTSTTLNTSLNIIADLSPRNGLNYVVRITGGTGAGQQRNIASSTYGANATLTVSSAWSVTPDATSTFALHTGRVYFFGGGTLAAGSFKYWDHATQTWSGNLSITNLAASMGTDCKLVGQSSVQSPVAYTGTATSGSATTLVNSAKTWATNQFANWQVRITAGTGAGGIRAITSNTGTTLTIASGTALDATSQYSIEPSDDYLYLLGNAAVTLYRYSVSGNTWTVLSPVAARSGAPGAALSATIVWGCTDSVWTSESTVRNCNRIYSFRGGGSATVDYYDIGQNTWVSGITYARTNETLTTGAGYTYTGGNYIYIQKEQASGTPTRFFRFDVRQPSLDAWSTNVFPAPAAATLGDKVFASQYHDGSGTPLFFIYCLQPAGTQLHRCLIW